MSGDEGSEPEAEDCAEETGDDNEADYLTKDQFFSSRYAVLIGFIFAAVIAQSFENYGEILFTPWSDFLAFFALISLYAFVILSWAGYQQSLKSYIYTDSKISVLRVLADSLIVVVYVFMLNSIQDIQMSGNALDYQLGFILTFVAYIFSGRLRQWEYDDGASKQSALYKTLLALILVFAIYAGLRMIMEIRSPVIDWLGVILPLIITLVWRYRRDIGGVINT